MRTRLEKPLTFEEFKSIYSKVNRLNVELVIMHQDGVVLTLRDIQPWKGEWHLPGGTVYYREPIKEAVERIAFEELGIEVEIGECLGYIEYPGIIEHGGVGSPIGIAFKCTPLSTDFKLDEQSSDVGIFNDLPKNTIKDQVNFLENLGIAQSR